MLKRRTASAGFFPQIWDNREGVEIAKSTMTSWVGQCVKLLHPLIDELKQSVFSASHLHGDDTPVKVLAPGLGKTKIGRIWSYVRDSRPYGDSTPPAVCYFYSSDRKGERPKEHLQEFSGVLHADAYAGYNQLYVSKKNPTANITEAACWAHTRRKFYEVTVVSLASYNDPPFGQLFWPTYTLIYFLHFVILLCKFWYKILSKTISF